MRNALSAAVDDDGVVVQATAAARLVPAAASVKVLGANEMDPNAGVRGVAGILGVAGVVV